MAMLVDIVTAIIAFLAHFVFALVKPVQVEQMSNDSHYWPNAGFFNGRPSPV